jgi:hypothetical protein
MTFILFNSRACIFIFAEEEEEEEKLRSPEETDVNEVSVRFSSNPMPTGQRYGGKDLLLPFESRHYGHQSLVTRTKMVSF